jgi:hypothetical protein
MANINHWILKLKKRELKKSQPSLSTSMLVLWMWNDAYQWRIPSRFRSKVRKHVRECVDVSREDLKSWYSKVVNAVWDSRMQDVDLSTQDTTDVEFKVSYHACRRCLEYLEDIPWVKKRYESKRALSGDERDNDEVMRSRARRRKSDKPGEP